MQKINFQDLPSTATPINATNLNAIQTNAEDAINTLDDKIDESVDTLNDKIDGENWHDMQLVNNWETWADTYQKAQYKKVGNKVILRGMLKSGSSGTSFTTLPSGYRPQLNNYVPCADDNGATSFMVYSNGICSIYSYNNWVCLTGAEFYID